MRIPSTSMSLAFLVALALAGCEAESGVPPEVQRRRVDAARDACIAAELERRAEENVSSLEEMLSAAESDPSALAGAGSAALRFARVYEQHATLRAVRAAHVDSSFNHSARAADSARHVERAEAVRVHPPERGTVEANVLSSYENDFSSIRTDPDHPCNWDDA